MGRVIVGKAVGTDHGRFKRKDALHIVLMHPEIDGARRQQALNGLLLGEAQLSSNRRQLASRMLWHPP